MGVGRSCLWFDSAEGQIHLDDMLDQCDSGDIILFEDPFSSSALIKIATDSKWNHVGMILKYTKNPAETILVESAGCGVFICYAHERLQTCLSQETPTIIGWRHLMPIGAKPKDFKKKLHKRAEELIDTPYEQNFADFVKAWAADSDFTKWVLSNLGGTLEDGATRGEDMSSVFCSELCAHLYKHMSLLDKEEERDANAYSPKDFSSQSNAHLAIKKPFNLTREKHVVLTGPKSAKIHAEGKGAGTHGTHGTVDNFIVAGRGQQSLFASEAILKAIEAEEKVVKGGGSSAVLKGLKAALEIQRQSESMPASASEVNFDTPGGNPDKQKAGCC